MIVASIRSSLLVGAILAAVSTGAFGEVALPAIFGDHMVLQQGRDLPIWGTASPGESVTVSLGGQTDKAQADAQGQWLVKLPPFPKNSAPGELHVEGTNKLILTDVLVGDVWLCSGQSNMEFGVNLLNDATTALAKADYPDIRLFLMDHQVGLLPLSQCTGHWVKCSAKSLQEGGFEKNGKNAGFSAVAFFFAREIYEARHVPLGLVQATWGGTPAQTWVSLDSMASHPELGAYVAAVREVLKKSPAELKAEYEQKILPKWQEAHDAWQKQSGATYGKDMKQWQEDLAKIKPGETPPPKPVPPPAKPTYIGEQGGFPSVLFNGMINPIIPFALKGVIWYQGESNASERSAKEYEILFPTLIADWRQRWGQGDFPFLFVQLAGLRSGQFFPQVREAQRKTLSLPNTGMAVAADIGDPLNIHPQDKTDVGHRIALVARKVAYQEDLVSGGPLYEASQVTGGKVRLHFRDVGQGLVIGSPSPGALPPQHLPSDHLIGFMVAGADGKYLPAQAVIEKDTVVVWNDQVADPKAVRYGWDPFPQMNLYNKEGLPASPFDTATGK